MSPIETLKEMALKETNIFFTLIFGKGLMFYEDQKKLKRLNPPLGK